MKIKSIIESVKKLFCRHPFDKSKKIITLNMREGQISVNNKVMDMYSKVDGHHYVLHIRLCGVCGKHFIDEGYEIINKEGPAPVSIYKPKEFIKI